MYLELQHIKKSFDGAAALKDAVLTAQRGSFVSVIGPSGAGKTTLFRILNGSVRADSGTYMIDGMDMMKASRRELAGFQRRIGTIYQDFCLVEPVSCMQNVLNACLPEMNFFSAVLGIFGKNRTEEAQALLERVGLKDKLWEPVKHLSGGQKQRVAIARALMCHPDILLADEPVASLDPVTGRQILELLKELQVKDGITVLMNSHDLNLALEFSDRIMGLKDGCTVFDGAPSEASEEVLSLIYERSGS